jgi:hypothetical protein
MLASDLYDVARKTIEKVFKKLPAKPQAVPDAASKLGRRDNIESVEPSGPRQT